LRTSPSSCWCLSCLRIFMIRTMAACTTHFHFLLLLHKDAQFLSSKSNTYIFLSPAHKGTKPNYVHYIQRIPSLHLPLYFWQPNDKSTSSGHVPSTLL
jgi:hypothetical protein